MEHDLPLGYELKFPGHTERYTITGVIGRGASTTAYAAENELGDPCILKEYTPGALSIRRADDGSLLCGERDRARFEQGKQHFLQGARKQHALRKQIRLRNCTPPARRVLEANNTLYFEVTAYSGQTFDKLMGEPLRTRLRVCLAAAELVGEYHRNDLLCLDLKPENLFVLTKPTGEYIPDLVEYIDFDSVRGKEEPRFGDTVSCTPAWAAPEQVNPFAFRRIGEATDIYTLGELVFWCVFGRHSTTREQSAFACYPFDEVRDRELERNSVKNGLSALFRQTLRPSAGNRCQSVGEMVGLLRELVEELEQKTYLICPEIRPKAFFVGREGELRELEARLREERTVFLHGIGGIGKSEIVRQYADAHRHDYRHILYWAYTGDLEGTVCRDDFTAVSTVFRAENESDHSYCRRKLRAVQGCLTGENLLIIDGMDIRPEDEAHPEVWTFLQGLPCRIVVTTRAAREEHGMPVTELAETGALEQIFAHYCPYPREQEPQVREIIRRLDRHTLLVELAARQARASASTPEQLLVGLERRGIGSLDQESVGISKDGTPRRGTVPEHINTLFSMADMSAPRQLLLTKAAFLPESGISAAGFGAFHGLTDHNDLNWLIDNGWIFQSPDHRQQLTVHPVIREAVIRRFQGTDALWEPFFGDMGAALTWREAVIGQRAHWELCAAIAEGIRRHRLELRPAAVYLVRYTACFQIFGYSARCAGLLKYAIAVLERQTAQKPYSAILEYAWLLYIPYLPLSEEIRQCRIHLARARNAGDLYLMERYYFLLRRLLPKTLDTIDENTEIWGLFKNLGSSILCYFRGNACVNRIMRDLKRKKPRHMAEDRLKNELDYDYLAAGMTSAYFNAFLQELAHALESEYSTVFFGTKAFSDGIRELRRANWVRGYLWGGKTSPRSANAVEMAVNEAKILFLQGNYPNARRGLAGLVSELGSGDRLPTMALVRLHYSLGGVAAAMGDYPAAVAELRRSLELSGEIKIEPPFWVRTQLGRFLNRAGALAESEEYNTQLLDVVRKLEHPARGTYYGDVVCNLAELRLTQKKPRTALNYCKRAWAAYQPCFADDFLEIGKARCQRLMARIQKTLGNEDAAKAASGKAAELYIACLGKSHPETVDFLKQIK